ncbi:hypothetical protein PBAL39_02052 [Pedobacter sp. BAL39]|uniref:hypothetical protein n=1 Tax=Pedobacter sp. BAL39 TaxID=391596 RepID=UPI0001559C99|nr:hypothetical protein [Pedobacter sp. BAL39]EDM38359.1 hypothetical protein PBAL39_02052 [Pedobacter sp. BAL39]
MKIRNLILVLGLLPAIAFSQKTIVPGSPDIKTTYLKPEKSAYTVYYVKDTSWNKMGMLDYDIAFSGSQLNFNYKYTDKSNTWSKRRTSVVDAKTLKPISFMSEGVETKLVLNFGESIKGTYYSKKKNKTTQVNVKPKTKFIDFNLADHLFCTLPLDVGYKAIIPEFYYAENTDTLITNYIIKEVKSYVYQSPRTGKHQAWLVTVLEESTGAIYNYVVDKKDRRLWQREMSMGKGMWEICVNEEIDYQPIKNKFDSKYAIRQVTKGNSVVIGTAYARESSGKKLGGLVNTAKKQFAPKGTEITLFPSSAYYEEWLSVNKQIKKQGKMPEVPLVSDFGTAIKKTKVYDDEGHFEFLDLMPGTYVVMASFDFTNSYNYSYVSGYTNYYNYWGYTGSTTNYGSARQSYRDKANIEKQVTIDKDGEKKEVSLKEK